MSSDSGTEAFMEKAKVQEEKYDWLGAAQSYTKALRRGPRDAFLAAEIWERVGLCYDRASRQSEDLVKFKMLRRRARIRDWLRGPD